MHTEFVTANCTVETISGARETMGPARRPFLLSRPWNCLGRSINSLLFLLPLTFGVGDVRGATLTMQDVNLGNTPNLLAYNSGHFYPGSNTKEWWRYAGVSGARVFLTSTIIENVDDIPGHGDGVTDEAGFLARRTALRGDPLNPAFINWPNFTNRYNTTAQHGANRLQPNLIFSELRKLGVQIDVNITAGLNSFVITNTADWAGKWELWQHYYAQAFYLGRGFDVQRFQMFNEPDHSSAGGLTQGQYLERLQLCSDAIQCALADVNALYGRPLVPTVLAPVITSSSYNSWAQLVVNNRHVNFLGQTDPNFWLLHQYDYHQYNATPTSFGANLASLRSALANAMSPEPPFPVSISEFNVHTAANFDTMPDTLDYPTKYPRLGAIVVNLVQNGMHELYNFKFSQTDGDADDVYPVRKNGMHYVDNHTAPYNIGGITKAGEVWRLFNKGFAPGRLRKDFSADSSLSHLALLASHDPVAGRYYVFSANFSTTAAPLTVDVSAFNIPDKNRVLIEEVSEDRYGSVAHYTRVLGGQVITFTQPTGSVWLVTISAKPQHFNSPDVPTFTLAATQDATVKDGANKTINFGAQTNLIIRNDPANVANRSAALLKFRLPTIYLPDVQVAVLTVSGATLQTNATVQAHVFGQTNNAWSQTNVTWATAPNLSQNVAAGNRITNQFVYGLGDSAFLQGQLVFASTNFATQQIDVTAFIRGLTNYDASFLVAQEPRWNLALPALTPGDTQPDGMQLVSSEGGANAPQLLFVRLLDSDNDGISDEAEINIFGTDPNNPDTDGDGISDGEEILILGTDPGHYPAWPAITTQPTDQTVGVGDTASFAVAASGLPPLAYEWRLNATNLLAGETNAVLVLNNVQTSQAGDYRVTVSNPLGSLASSNAVLVVTNPVPFVPGPPPMHEPFAYSIGTPLVGQGGWLLNSGTTATVEAGNLDVPGLLPASGNRLTWGSPSMSLRLPLGTNLTTGEIFFSFALRVDTLGASFTTDGTLAGVTTGSGTLFGGKINIRPNGTGGFNLGMSKAGGTTYGAWATNEFVPGEIVFAVGRYRFNSGSGTDDQCDLWLNPDRTTFGASEPPPATIAGVGAGGSDLSQVDRFFFRSGGSSSSPAKLVTDELRIGFTWVSVRPPAAIASLSFVASGGTATLRWPTNAAGYVLEKSATLVPAAWSDADEVVSTHDTNYFVTVFLTNSSRYYRLRP